jgi:hypothetical protein
MTTTMSEGSRTRRRRGPAMRLIIFSRNAKKKSRNFRPQQTGVKWVWVRNRRALAVHSLSLPVLPVCLRCLASP